MTGRHERPGRLRGSERRARRVVEASDYVAFLGRAIEAWGDRIAADPAVLVHSAWLAATFRDSENRGIFEANRRQGGYSQREIAAILGVSQPAVQKRARLGEAVYAARQQALGAGPLIRLAEVRRARAAGLSSAGVPDRTGSHREKAAGL